MRRNIQRLLSVLTLAITLICPLKGWAQESSIQDTVSIEKQSAHKWYNLSMATFTIYEKYWL